MSYVVIFTSRLKQDSSSYDKTAKRMEDLAAEQPGFLGIESLRNDEGFGITISYWKSLEDVARWKAQSEHLEAQASGKKDWYSQYTVRICKVERQYSFGAKKD